MDSALILSIRNKMILQSVAWQMSFGSQLFGIFGGIDEEEIR